MPPKHTPARHVVTSPVSLQDVTEAAQGTPDAPAEVELEQERLRHGAEVSSPDRSAVEPQKAPLTTEE